MVQPQPENRSIQSSKERSTRLISNSNNSWSQQQLTPQSNSLASNGFNRQIIASSQNSAKTESNVPINQRKIFNGQTQQVQNAGLLRQFCIYYHYYLVELYVHAGYIKSSVGHVELLYLLYYSLSLLIKYKSTYCISIMSIHYK